MTDRARRWGLAVVLGLVALSYAGDLSNGFVWDDRLQIVDNPHLQHVTELPRLFTQFSQSLNFPTAQPTYRPLFLLSLMIDRLVWGLDPFGFHLTNLLLHVANVILVFVLGVALSGSPEIALLASAIFGLHPVQLEVVDWISGRSEAIVALFALLAVVSYWNWSRSEGRRAAVWGTASIAATACALLSKETAIAIPLAVLLVEWLRGGGLRWSATMRVSLIAAPVAVYLLIRLSTMLTIGQSAAQFGWGGLVTTGGQTAVEYLRVIMWPAGLTVVHDLQPVAATPGRLLAVSTGSVVTAAVVWIACRKWPVVGFGLLWAVAFLLPSFVLIVMSHSYLIAERSLYLPMVGVAVAVGWTVWKGMDVLKAMHGGGGRVAGLAVLVLLVAGMVRATMLRHAVWKDDLTLWGDAVAKAPASGYARHNLAVELDRRGRTNEAVELLQEGHRRHPDDLETTVALGEFSLNLGDLMTASRMFRAAVGHHARWAERSILARAYYGLGLVLYDEGKAERARQHLETAIRLDPTYAEAYAHLGALYHEDRRLERAITLYEAALSWRSNDAETLYNYALALDQAGRRREAISAYRRFLATLSGTDRREELSRARAQAEQRLRELAADPDP